MKWKKPGGHCTIGRPLAGLKRVSPFFECNVHEGMTGTLNRRVTILLSKAYTPTYWGSILFPFSWLIYVVPPPPWTAAKYSTHPRQLYEQVFLRVSLFIRCGSCFTRQTEIIDAVRRRKGLSSKSVIPSCREFCLKSFNVHDSKKVPKSDFCPLRPELATSRKHRL